MNSKSGLFQALALLYLVFTLPGCKQELTTTLLSTQTQAVLAPSTTPFPLPTSSPSPTPSVNPSPIPTPTPTLALPTDGGDVTLGMGINIHFVDDPNQEISRIAAAGFKIVRMDFVWGWIETTPGIYDFSAYDRLVAEMVTYGIRPYFIFDYTNALYDKDANGHGVSPHTVSGRNAFAQFATAAALHFLGKNIIWEIYNEPNGQDAHGNGVFWTPQVNASDYNALAQTVARAVHSVAPGEILVGPAAAGKSGVTDGSFDFNFINSNILAGLLSDWSCVSVHSYRRGNQVPETVNVQYGQINNLIQANSRFARPICSGEWGYSSTADIDEATQAKYAARIMLINVLNNLPVSILYDWRGTPGTTGVELGFDIVHADLTPKPAYNALSTLLHFLQNYAFHGRVTGVYGTDQNDYIGDFRTAMNQAEPKFVAWSATPGRSVQIKIPGPIAHYRITDLMGQIIADEYSDSSGIAVTMTDSPVFIEILNPPAGRRLPL